MKFLIYALIFFFFFLIVPNKALADTTPTPTTTTTPTPPQITSSQGASMIVDSMKSFISGIDGWLGGFIFYTPDLFGDNIILQDGTNLGTITNFRNLFYLISIPLVAIVVAFSALHIMNAENTAVIKPFLVRLLFVGALLIITPQLLSLTIQINNELVHQILQVNTLQQQPQFTSFITDYFTSIGTQLAAGASPDQLGIPSFDFPFQQSVVAIMGLIFLRLLLFLIMFIVLILALFFILFQFIMRFLSLLFLSILFPLVVPFLLSSKTQNITKSYFQAWISYLVHQPAFVLAYMLTLTILKTALSKNGASVGILLLYVGSLFFLGGINVLATQLFGQPWTALATEAQAFLASRSITNNFTEVKRGLVGGSVTGVKSLAGRKLGQQLGFLTKAPKAKAGDTIDTPTGNSSTSGGTQQSGSETSKTSYGKTHTQDETVIVTPPPAQHASFTQELQAKGMQTRIVDQKQGIVSIEGEGFKYKDQATGLTSIYPTKQDAIADGIPENDLQPAKINRQNFIDLSTFDGKTKNPHNAFATVEAKKQGHPSNYAHLTSTSDQTRVKNFLQLSREQNERRGVKGVIVKRYGNSGGERTKERVVRLYTTENV